MASKIISHTGSQARGILGTMAGSGLKLVWPDPLSIPIEARALIRI